MATIKISDLQQFSSVSTGDFALVVNTETRTPKKIAISDLITVNRNNIFSRYNFSRGASLTGFDQSSISFQAKNLENKFVYNIPETITLDGFSLSNGLLNKTFNLSGIKDDNFCWSGAGFSIQKSGENPHWDICQGSTILFKLTGSTTYPQFGPVDPLTTGGAATSETGVIARQTKTQNSPFLFSAYNTAITGLVESSFNVALDSFESAEISYKHGATYYPSSGSGNLIFSNNNESFKNLNEKGSVTSITSTGALGQTIFELDVSGFSVNNISESVTAHLGSFNFSQGFVDNFKLTNDIRITGVIVDDSLSLLKYKPQLFSQSLDINNDGIVSNIDDMLLFERYAISGLTGADLITGITFGTGSGIRSGAAEIASFIQSGLDLNAYDINEDGAVGSDDITFITGFASGLVPASTGRNGSKESHLQNNLQKIFNI
tara:strand:- start:3713 stop:5014 length:1302 start_codon:yes stop_codon:yes gene_type:complete